MKYFCYVNVKMNSSRKNAIAIMYPRIVMIKGLKELYKSIKPMDTVVFDSILELDSTGQEDIAEIKLNYLNLVESKIELNFDRSPNCDSAIISMYSDMISSGCKDEDINDMILEMQIESYKNIKDATSNMKKYSQLAANKVKGVAYGRPKGSKKDSELAIRTKAYIKKNCKTFGGNLTDKECITNIEVSRNSYYIYKRQLKEEMEGK